MSNSTFMDASPAHTMESGITTGSFEKAQEGLMTEISDALDVTRQPAGTEAQSLSRDLWNDLGAQTAEKRGGRTSQEHTTLDFNAQELYNNNNRRDVPDNQVTQARSDDTSCAKYIDRTGIEVDDGDSDYRGTYIPRDIAGSKYGVRAGDTLTSIARTHLGAGASLQEVENHAREIEHMNDLTPGARLIPGQRLILPGHTSDGGFTFYDGGSERTVWQDGTVRVERGSTGYVRRPDGSEHHWGPQSTDNYDVSRTSDGGIQVTDSDGDNRTRWSNGVVRVMNHDGTGYVHRPSANGTYSEHHWGPRPQDNYELTRSAEGRYLIANRAGEPPRDATDIVSDIRVQSPRLRDIAQQRITDQQARQQFMTDMDRFEDRARSQNLPPEEVARTYDAISQILAAEGDSPLRQDERLRVAQDVLQNSAEPTSVNQGMHPTCSVAALEVRTYTRTPSAAARLVASVATTTHFQTADGSIIDISSGSLHADGDSYRNQASQIFQVSAINVFWQRHGDIRYEQQPINVGQMPPDAGDRIFDYSRNPPREFTSPDGSPLRQPWVNGDAIHEINTQITGRAEAPFVLSRADSASVTGSTFNVSTPQELESALVRLQSQGNFPAVLHVHSRNEPFWADSGSGAAGGSGGWHVVAITDYRPGPPATVALDNTWGSQADHLSEPRRISVDQLFASMHAPAH